MTDQVSYGPPTTGAAGTEYAGSGRASGPRAGFWRRFAAALIDGIIVLVVLGVLSAIIKGAGYGIGLLLSIAYFVYFEGGETGQTPGKRALGIRVVDFSTGGPIGYGRAFVRWIGRIISSAVVYLGYLWMLWDREKQTWHDKLANDVVVPVSDYPVAR
jgi:uncharacterized RDD family membrane protein YckC